jgi:hypothetical protein
VTTFIENKEVSVHGRFFRTAKLRHEWCDFLQDIPAALPQLRTGRRVADVFTFVRDIGDETDALPYPHQPTSIAVMPVTTHEKWWNDIGFKPRNKIRKGQKSGVVTSLIALNDDFARQVEAIYNEAPLRQGRKFFHYGKKASEIKEELSSFLDRSIIIGAYIDRELVGFMKLFRASRTLRTIHIIAKLAHREKCAMDVLISKAVELCEQNGLKYFHYGSWTDGGVGAFRSKHGFEPMEVQRYFVPLTAKGKLMLKLNFHRPLRERLPGSCVQPLLKLRAQWNSMRLGNRQPLAQG